MDKKIKLLTRKEYDKWLAALPKNVCTFCQWSTYQSVIKEFKYWVWINNIAPYWYFHTLFVPKRHFEREADMTIDEMAELVRIKEFAFDVVMSARLTFPNGRNKGQPVEKFVYFHRFRVNRFDPISGTMRPAHYHDHFCPDIDHRWDSTLNKDAKNYPITDFIETNLLT